MFAVIVPPNLWNRVRNAFPLSLCAGGKTLTNNLR